MSPSDMRVYVGTYAKYNDGDLSGEWLDIEDFADAEDFYEKCREIHGPGDHEFMFQDHEGIPDDLISECHLDPEVFELARLRDDEFTILCLYRDEINQDGTVKQAKESFLGRAKDKAEFAEQMSEERGDLASVPDFIRNHIDFDSIADEWCDGGYRYVEHDGEVWVFDINV